MTTQVSLGIYDNHKQLCDSQGQTQAKFKDSDLLVVKNKVETTADDEEYKPVTNVANDGPAPSVVLHIKMSCKKTCLKSKNVLYSYSVCKTVTVLNEDR